LAKRVIGSALPDRAWEQRNVALEEYRRKRSFDKTPEPADAPVPPSSARRFCLQRHDATRLHYDFRLELNGVLKSWAVPKGPSLTPGDKRLAVATEDHPLSYLDWEGTIPAGQYGGGDVMVFDLGEWEPLEAKDPEQSLLDGELKLDLDPDEAELALAEEERRLRGPGVGPGRTSVERGQRPDFR
jgi:bifunctional non-homologous end joining protein LigD